MRALFIKLDTTAPAFGNHYKQRGQQAAATLRALADALENFGLENDGFYNLRDRDGNAIGHAGMDEDTDPNQKGHR